jgi:DNA-binding transcriptional ArsR family regulator
VTGGSEESQAVVDPFAALADPTRRRILELLVAGERSAGDLTADIRAEAGLSQPTVSQHLAALRTAGLVAVRVDGARRLYSTNAATLGVVAAWIDGVTPSFVGHLDALATEVARGRHARRTAGTAPDPPSGAAGSTGHRAS